MSLTQIIKDTQSPARQEMIEHCRRHYPRLSRPPLQCPSLVKGTEGIIGNSFDYLVKYFFKLNYPDLDIRFLSIEDFLRSGTVKNLDDFVFVGKYATSYENAVLAKGLKESYLDSLRQGYPSEAFLIACYRMGQIENWRKSGMIYPLDLNTVDPENIRDLSNLYSLLKVEDFPFKERIFLNPEFGKAGRLVRGAEADIILDDMLLEIKTVQEFSFNLYIRLQLVGYLVLMRIEELEGTNNYGRINTIGVYHSRYGKFIKYPVNFIISDKKITYLAEFFKKEYDYENRLRGKEVSYDYSTPMWDEIEYFNEQECQE